jgi:hypothetical protein
MGMEVQIEERDKSDAETAPMLPYYSIVDLARRWRCSRGTVYNIIRGERVLDFAAPGHKGKKLVAAKVVRRIEENNMRVWR